LQSGLHARVSRVAHDPSFPRYAIHETQSSISAFAALSGIAYLQAVMTPRGSATVLLACVVLGAAARVAAVESGAQSVVRRFCQADGLGQRVQIAGWAAIAPLVTWALEPAWDHVVLIGGYEVDPPRRLEDGGVAIDVRYAVIGEVSPLGLDTAVHRETVEFRIDAANGAWRILGPPLPPHIFAHRVDMDALRRSLQFGGLNFLPNSIFIWRMFQSAGWRVAFVPTIDLLNGQTYRAVDKPKVGDLAVYLRDGVPYHVGILEADDQIVSSTLNAGIVRTALDAFPGEVRYLRLVEPEPAAEAMPIGTPSAKPSPRRTAAAQPRRAASPAVKRGEDEAPKSHRSDAQPSKRKRVEPSGAERKPERPTPIATGQVP
jgi:hypothetical protein